MRLTLIFQLLLHRFQPFYTQKSMRNSVITGTGKYIPNRIIENDYFINNVFYTDDNQLYDKSAQEVIEKFVEITEIKQRRYAEDYQVNSDLATFAAEEAIKSAGIDRNELDYVIVAHNYGDIDSVQFRSDMMPSLSARVKHKLNIKNNRCRPYDMNFGCPGWVEGLIMAHQFIQANLANKILIIGSETLSRAVDIYDRNAMIFADGAGAVILEAQESSQKNGILSYLTISDNGEEISFLGNGPSLNTENHENCKTITMKGRKIYEYALRKVPAVVKTAIEAAKLDIKDIKKVFLHQANAKMDHAMIERLFKLYGLAEIPEFIAPMTVGFLGNSSVATIPTMYDMVLRGEMENHSLQSGDIVAFGSVGAGMNINAVIYQLP